MLVVYSKLVGSVGRSVAVLAFDGILDNVLNGIIESFFVEETNIKSVDVVLGGTVLVLGFVVRTKVFSVDVISPDVRFLRG